RPVEPRHDRGVEDEHALVADLGGLAQEPLHLGLRREVEAPDQRADAEADPVVLVASHQAVTGCRMSTGRCVRADSSTARQISTFWRPSSAVACGARLFRTSCTKLAIAGSSSV